MHSQTNLEFGDWLLLGSRLGKSVLSGGLILFLNAVSSIYAAIAQLSFKTKFRLAVSAAYVV
jgi:hypothetical protein